MTLPTDPEFTDALGRLTFLEGTSETDVIRAAVLARAEQLSVERSSHRMRAQWAEVLDRLGKA